MVTSRWNDASRNQFELAAHAAVSALQDHIAAVSASHSDADSGTLAETAQELEMAMYFMSVAEEKFTGAAAFWVEDPPGFYGDDDLDALDEDNGAADVSNSKELSGPVSCMVELRLYLDLDEGLVARAQKLLPEDDIETIPDAIFAVAATHGWDAIMADYVEDVHLASAVAEVHLTEQDQDHDASE